MSLYLFELALGSIGEECENEAFLRLTKASFLSALKYARVLKNLPVGSSMEDSELEASPSSPSSPSM